MDGKTAEKAIEKSGQNLLIFLIILTFLYVILQNFSPFFRIAVPLATAIAVYRTMKASERKSPETIETKTWKLVAVCLGIWLAGELSVVAFFAREGFVPYPSLAEISYLIGYVLMGAGAFSIIRKVDVKLPITHILTFTLVVLLFSGAVTNFVIARALMSEAPFLEKAFNIGLPIADMMLIIVVFAIYFVYFGSGRKERLLEESWAVVILGMTFSAFADIIMTYSKIRLIDSIYLALLPGILYIWSRGVVGLGAKARSSN
ncbi:MAG: hypothetical protein V1820_02885 [archaeon]